MVQVILSLLIILIILVALFFLYRLRANERPDADYARETDLDVLGEILSKDISEYVRTDGLDVNVMGYEHAIKVRERLAEALDNCIYGIPKYRRVVISQLRKVINERLPEDKDLLAKEGANFNDLLYEVPANLKWEALIYFVRNKKNHKYDTMRYLNKKYHLSTIQEVENPITGGTNMRALVDEKRLDDIIKSEIGNYKFNRNELVSLLAIVVYERRYGFGIIDTLRGLDVDGFNFGTSGSVRYTLEEGNTQNIPYTTMNSVWVQLDATWIHFAFLDFGSEDEMKRIVNQLVSYGTTAPMTEKQPYKVNDGYDGARITAIRPPAGESWACFVRKFSAGLYVKEKLLNKPEVHNWELPSQLMYYLMRAEQTVPFTGQQNTGKTSMMKAVMADIKMVNIRILEMSFELAIRELYPWMNVITVKPTDYVSSEELQDLLKKTDGYLSMVGEVATNVVASRMIQFCLIASAFTIFSHHAKTDYDLVNGLANSLVASGEYENHDVAISTVLDAIHHNVHLDFVKGQRVIEHISQIIKLDEVKPYPEVDDAKDVLSALNTMNKLNREYYTRSTDRVRFTARKIITFNPENMTYEATDTYTDEKLREMLYKLKGQDRQDFIKFYRENWGHLFNKEHSS